MKKLLLCLSLIVLSACGVNVDVDTRVMKNDDLLTVLYDGDTYVETVEGINPTSYVRDHLQILNTAQMNNEDYIVQSTFYDNHTLADSELIKEGTHEISVFAKTKKDIFYSNTYDVHINETSKRINVKYGYPVDSKYHITFKKEKTKEEFEQIIQKQFPTCLDTISIDPPYSDDVSWYKTYVQYEDTITLEDETYPIQFTFAIIYGSYYLDQQEYITDMILTRELYLNVKDQRIQLQMSSAPSLEINDNQDEITILFFNETKDYQYHIPCKFE